MKEEHPLAAKMKGVPLDSKNIFSNKEEGDFEFSWAGKWS